MTWRRINWWMVAFIVALFAFEFAREFAVLALDPPIEISAYAGVSRSADGNVLTAIGRWRYFDPGDDQPPNGYSFSRGLSIRCEREGSACYVAETIVMREPLEEQATQLHIERRPARFTPEGAIYVDDEPNCARQVVRLDVIHNRVDALDGFRFSPSEGCTVRNDRGTPSRMVGDPPQERESRLARHFVPLIWLVSKFVPVQPPPHTPTDTP